MNNETHETDGDEPMQQFEVKVPYGAPTGQPFALSVLVGGVQVQVQCPANARRGQRVRFKMPKAKLKAVQIKFHYRKDGWARCVDPMDLLFRWVRMDCNDDVIDIRKRFDPMKSAFVRKLEFMEGEGTCIRRGVLSFVPASEAVMDSTLVCYSDIANAQVKNFEEKVEWFQESVDWREGHVRLKLRRKFLFADSVDVVMSLTRNDFRKIWRLDYTDDMRIDEGGWTREWFQLVTAEIFHPDMGLWHPSAASQMRMQVNPASAFLCKDHLVYYRFLGRVMGMALVNRQLVAGHMAQYMYKHILGWPITWKDLEAVDGDLYTHLNQLVDMVNKGDDIAKLGLNFTTTQEMMASREEVELIENGKNTKVTADNLPEYLEAAMKYRMLDCIRPQLNELLLGFFDAFPETLLTVFDYEELEWLMCGIADVDIQDWKDHTEYSGEFEQVGGDHITCQWFWEVITEFDCEMQMRLLQFATGSFVLPSGGFGALHGKDGNVQKFTIHGVLVEECLYPRANTGMNRIDLPLYESCDELKEKLTLVVKFVAPAVDNE